MKKCLLVIVSAFLLLLLSGCASLDVIGTGAQKAFVAVLEAMPTGLTTDDAHGGFTLEAPDGSAWLVWSKDYSRGMPYDIMMIMDAQPFLDAGLDMARLPNGMLEGDRIVLGVNLGSQKPAHTVDATPSNTFAMIVQAARHRIFYHVDMDHFALSFDGGNQFEWAKYMGLNEKDVVFSLDPQPLLDAGVDPEKAEGWSLAAVSTMEENGRKSQVDRFQKSFNIK